MSVTASISDALRRFGRTMVLRRNSKSPDGTLVPSDVDVYGTDDQMVIQRLFGAQLAQGKSKVIVSNAEILERQWPGPPRRSDILVIDDVKRTIDSVDTKRLGDEVLVHVCDVIG